jgi:mannose-6-phosphate isomerase-like protein (cupin superfamily)
LAGSACAADNPAPAPAPAAPPPAEVVLYNHLQVDHLFATAGGPLQMNSLYKVMTARRVVPGPVEIHVRDTDVFYIVDGTATFVTGGTAVDPVVIRPNELHAKSITGGTEHQLVKGDVIIIPHGIPHQFSKIDNQFLYFVVKVTE